MTDFYVYASVPGTKLSNVNRKFGTSVKKIVKETELANGSLVRDVVAVKRSWQFSWEYLPSLDADVVDGGMGADSLEALFDLTGVLVLSEPLDSGISRLYNTLVASDGFKKDQVLRRAGGKRYWNCSLSLREV
jgi:hypothetical protein